VDGIGGVAAHYMKTDMEKAGFTRSATQLGLIRLGRLGYVEAYEDGDYNGNETWTAYRLTTKGEDWLLENADKLEMRLPSSRNAPIGSNMKDFAAGVGDDDVPF
jgi:hypothetical protein